MMTPSSPKPQDAQSATCPECRESIDPEARRCKHCGANVQAARRAEPHHGGTCPFCREQIDPEAVVCKHCKSQLLGAEAGPDHGGTCPFCREPIDPAAVICKHCGSMLTEDRATVAARMGSGGLGRGYDANCMDICYRDCRAKTNKGADACWDQCFPGCSGSKGRITWLGGDVFGGIDDPVMTRMANPAGTGQPAPESPCGCSENPAIAREVSFAAPGPGARGGAVRWVTRCHIEYHWVCDALGCRWLPHTVCITTPEQTVAR